MKHLALIFAVACISCSVAYRVIGVQIDSDGYLREPFASIRPWLSVGHGCNRDRHRCVRHLRRPRGGLYLT